ncbi:hypothetical protein LJC25_00985 [Bacteroidales bacterium OttesenSCG-928-K03]|nr:hypothetical protein [Bacteroidales bacterium OttesenSCG-928-K22]MDL2242285.1 hypothetical protein [Bacteroidales bacterium OttesenSCG-928-K03]
MAKKDSVYRSQTIFGFTNLSVDFFELILCMFVSHYLIDNPLYGASIFLFVNIWILYFQGNLQKLRLGKRSRFGFVMWILLTASVFCGMFILFLFPVVTNNLNSNLVAFFTLTIAVRKIITYRINYSYTGKEAWNVIYKILFQILFLIPCAIFSLILIKGYAVYLVIGIYTLTGIMLAYQTNVLAELSKHIDKSKNDNLQNIFSYRVFTNMTLYSQIGFTLGVLMYICFMSFLPSTSLIYNYTYITLWLLIIVLSSRFFTWLSNKGRIAISLNLFIFGAILWVVSSVMMFSSQSLVNIVIWTILWGFGLSSITAVTNQYNLDFKMIAKIADTRISKKELYLRYLLTHVLAILISCIIMLLFVSSWSYFNTHFADITEVPTNYRTIMIQLPLLFMVISIIFALKQPLDERHKQKLEVFNKGVNANISTKQSLNERLVKKSRVRFGVKIIAAFVKPFLFLKVKGEENIDYDNFPSIFVCNHGIIYGPIAAVIYLPTYFRPWIDKKMCDIDSAAQEMYERHFSRWPLLSKKVKIGMSKFLSKPVTWAMTSFNPIPVEKSSLRGVVKTFESTVDVLAEGDNILIFPEKPKKVKVGRKTTIKHETDTVGNLYTGFASIGKLYFDQTGKALRFYPIFANKKNHTFNIGKPVVYDHNNNSHEEKVRIANELQIKMKEFSDQTKK